MNRGYFAANGQDLRRRVGRANGIVRISRSTRYKRYADVAQEMALVQVDLRSEKETQQPL